MQYTNLNNIPLPLAVFLATDDYDYEPNTISATTLLKPVKQIILSKRVNQDNLVDLSSLVSARMGSAIHTAIEKAWSNPSNALKKLGYPNHLIDNIVINPTSIKEGQIPIYMEQRSYKEVLGFKVSGKFDFVAEGKVQDFKSTSVYTYLNQTNKDKYMQQGSMYRWLNPDIIDEDEMNIHFIFTDWNKKDSLINPNYPNSRVLTQRLPLMSIDETDRFVKQKLTDIKTYIDKPEHEIPPCTDYDLWRKPTVYKYYKNPNSTRATKNYEHKSDAYLHYTKDGSVGIVKEVKGQVSACKYCPAISICKQAESLIQKGDLIL